MATILDRIVATKRDEIAAAMLICSLSQMQAAAQAAAPPRDFLNALRRSDRIALIAEIKKASPSKGIIRADFDPLAIARDYESGGADCLSVLTDESYFQGHLNYLTQVRETVSLPALRKDFIIDEYQVLQARAAGADAVLLIAECLSGERLIELHQLIRSLGMVALIELHDPMNLDKVLACQTPLIGINNRDLHTFKVDLHQTIRLRKQIPQEILVVGESGIRNHDDVRLLADNGINAILVGESLMVCKDLVTAVKQLLGKV